MAKKRKTRRTRQRQRKQLRAKPRPIKSRKRKITRAPARKIQRRAPRKQARKQARRKTPSRAELRKQLQSKQKIIDELVRRGRKPGQILPREEPEEEDEAPFVVPQGARVLSRDDKGAPTAFEIDPLLDEYGDFDTGRWDYEDDYADEFDHEDET